MKKILPIVLLFSILFINNCNIKKDNIPYKIASNYFVKNSFDTSGVFSIYTQEEFDTIFGMASIMGENRKPTSINFNNEYVLAIISKNIDSSKSYTPISLTKDKEDILLEYKTNIGIKLNYTIKPFMIIIVDKKYNGNLIYKHEK